jgi:serine/threonine protein kinase
LGRATGESRPIISHLNVTLQPGAQLGPYEIQWLIGRGGMGEVYRATDTRLHRPVAIKVLPEELTSSASALERLLREAQTASILNHPNICTIYDVGITNPAFIAMELLEGESLQHRLLRGPLDTHSLLDIAIAIADGLDAAHCHGFIHRDIKPANIFLTSHGPKLLDFGLAKTHAGMLAGAWSNDQTRPAEALLTEAGVTVGTVAYMSPEQLQGKDVDARTDEFSLGLVLYEMATGRPAFSAATSAAIGGAILYEQPIPPIDILRTIPSRLNDIVLKAIEKDREDRYQTAADLRTDLRRLRRELDSPPSQSTTLVTGGRQGSKSASAHVSANTRGVGQSTKRVSFGFFAAALVVAAVAAIAVYPRVSTTPAPLAPISIANVQVSRLTSTGDAVRAAIAPDGNYLAYVRQQKGLHSLHVRQAATAATAEIVKAEPDVTLWGATVSPDSGFVDYIRRRQGQTFELWRVPFLGGAPRRLLDRVNSPIGWSPDGRRFAFVRAEAPGTTFVVIAHADGSGERVLAERQLPAQFVSLMILARPSIAPTWSPNGGLLAVAGAGAGTDPNTGDVAIIDVDSGELRTIALPTSAVRGLVWYDESTLLLNAAIGGGSLQLHQLTYPTGDLNPLTTDVSDYDGISLAGNRQTLVGSRREQQTDFAILDGTGRTLTKGPNITARAPASVDWTSDRVLYSNWTWTPGRQPQQLLFDNGEGTTTASPDGRTTVFTRENVLWRANRDGGAATMLATGGAAHPVVTPDNRSVIFVSARSGLQSLWTIPLDGGEPRQLVSRFAAGPGVDISPDGQAVLFPSRDDNRKIGVVVICNLADCRPREVLAGVVSTRFRWMPNGRAIAFIESDARTNIYAAPVAGGTPTQLTHFDDRVIADFDWSPDGRQLVVARTLETNDIVVLKGLRRD